MRFILTRRCCFLFIITTVVLLFINVTCQGQSKFSIKGCVKGLPFNKIYFAETKNSKTVLLDSANAINNCFKFHLSDTLPSGMYNIILSLEHNSFIGILLNHEGSFEFSTNYLSMQDSMAFVGSKENTWYYSFLSYFSKASNQIDQIQKSLDIQDADTVVKKKLKEALSIQINNRNKYCLNLAKEHKGIMAAEFINASTPVEVPANEDSLKYLMEHFLDNVNFESNALFNSPLLLNAISNFMNVADKNSKNFNDLVFNYATIMDKVLEKSAGNLDIYNFYRTKFRQWLMYGNLDVISTYNDKFYTEEPHQINMQPEERSKRLASLVAVNRGKKAPTIVMTDYNGKPFTLDSISNEYTLLVFYSSNCSHCIETLPKLSRLYQTQTLNRLEVVAISFDTDKDAWLSFLKQGNYGWINYSDLQGWNSDIAKTYNIKGTPTYLLLDKNKYVIDKPIKFEELVADLQNLNILGR